jgi:isopenicillin N synthase-like dioxygenase
VSNRLLENMKFDIQEFFKLPMEEKKKYWQEPEDLEGYGQVFVVSEDQKLDWGDMFYMVTLPTYLRKPHLFPKLPIPFRSDLSLSLSLTMKKIAPRIEMLHIQSSVHSLI